MHRELRRAAPIALAVALGTAFLASVFMFQDSMWAAAKHDLDQAFEEYSLVVRTARHADPSPLDDRAAARIADLPGVEGVTGSSHGTAFVSRGDRAKAARFSSLDWLPPSVELAEGSLPQDGEVLISEAAARDYGTRPGAELTVAPTPMDTSGMDVKVSGLIRPTGVVLPGGEQHLYGTQATIGQLLGYAPGEYSDLLVAGGAVEDVADELASLDTVEQAGGATVQALSDFVTSQVKQVLPGRDYLSIGAATVALAAFIVLALVVKSAFGVQVEREARSYSLERLVGATRGQVVRGVLANAAWVGALSAVVGVAVGVGLIAALCAIPTMPLVFSASPASLLVAGLAGTLVCVIGAVAPALQAAKSSPLGAFKASASGRQRAKGSWRAVPWVRLALLAGAVSAMALFAVMGVLSLAIMAAVVVAVVTISLAGRVSTLAARAASRLGPIRSRTVLSEACERITANPGRSASITGLACAAVAFVALVGVGMSSAAASVGKAMSDVPQPDLVVVPEGEDRADATNILQTVTGLETVQDAAMVATSMVEVRVDGHETIKVLAVSASPEVAAVIHRGEGFDAVAPGTVVLQAGLGIPDQAEATVVGAAGEGRLTTEVHTRGDSAVFLGADDFGAVAGQGDPQIWLMFTPGADPAAASDQVKEALYGRTVSFYGTSEAVTELSGYMRLIVALALGLFGAGIIITVVGIANTIRVSAMERRQEMGLQRALGAFALSVRQGLVVESGLLVLVGSLVGLACGSGIGLVGAYALAQSEDGIGFAARAPGGFLAAVLATAVIVGALVAAAATRKAARVPPVAAIALQ
ncbi:MAG: ABC transporter permease [Bifidobacteriaceae bacterium]|jgi:putative ABC transport system permease protein|nr:ABC transporter permease [Bifidobacteriaceae bacterium]